MFVLDPFSILVLVVISLLLLNVFYDRKKNIYKNFPPGPTPLPIIGTMHHLLKKRDRPHQVFEELAKKYGPVYSLQIGSEKMVVLCGYEAVKEALIDNADDFLDRPIVPVVHEAAQGQGIIFANGENWKVMRRFALSTLRDFGMGRKLMEDKITEECNLLVDVFKSFKGKPFECTGILYDAIANIIVSILLGKGFEKDSASFRNLMHMITYTLKIFNSPMVLLFNCYPNVMRWVPGIHQTVLKNCVEMRSYIRNTFIKYKDRLDANDQRAFVDTFLVKQQEEKPSGLFFHNDNLVTVVNNLFVAGMETTSATLRWGLVLMMKYPEIQKNVQDEIKRVIGSAQPQSEHRKELPYTDAVIHEVQRFGNVVSGGVPRATSRDATFRGYFIPKGTQVLPVLGTVLQDKDYFEKPDEFYPQHFLDSKGNLKKNEAFLPFAAGRRACAGENLAKMELFLFFTTLMQKFTFQPPPGVKTDLTSFNGATVSPMMTVICALPRD
ncbi:cytochrome P450 2K1-like isoform 2-T2 [Pelodytes ibericus]